MKASVKSGPLPFLAAVAILVVLLFLCNRIYLAMEVQSEPLIPPGTEILILGDSHAAYALDPDIIGKAFNFSGFGESYVQNYYKLKYALKRSHSLKAVILPIDLHSFSDFRKDRTFFSPQWLRFSDFIRLGWAEHKPLSYLAKYVLLNLFEFRGKYSQFFTFYLKTRNKQKPIPPIYNGYTPQNKFIFFRREQQVQRAKFRARRQLAGFDCFSKEMVVFFKMILAECAGNDIQVILLKLPVSEIYYTEAGRLLDINQLYMRVSHIVHPYTNVHYLDYQKLYFKNGAGFFYDAQHLNKVGAENISRLINKDLLWLGNRH